MDSWNLRKRYFLLFFLLISCSRWEENKELSSIVLTDQNSREFRIISLKDKKVVYFFGFSHCPDKCPLALNTLTQVLSKGSRDILGVFVTLDPLRDDPLKLKGFMKENPSENMIALTGNPEDIQRFAKFFGILSIKRDISGEKYLLDHTNQFILVDKNFKIKTRVPANISYKALTKELEEFK